MQKRDIDKIKTLDLLKMSELAEYNGVRYSTIKHYSELGLLPYQQKERRLAKYYPRIEASRRLKEILKMREKGKSLTDIINYFITNAPK